MEYWVSLQGEYNVVVIPQQRYEHRPLNGSNQCIKKRLNTGDLGLEALRNKVLEDISSGPVKLFIDACEPIEDIKSKILARYPEAKFNVFISTFLNKPNRVISNVRCNDREQLNQIRKEIGYEPADEYIQIAGSRTMRFHHYNGNPSFMIQDVSSCLIDA